MFLSEFIHDDVEVGTFDVAQLKREQIEVVEADSFWCFSALLDTIQDNYTFAQPGIQRKVNELKNLMSTVDSEFSDSMDSLTCLTSALPELTWLFQGHSTSIWKTTRSNFSSSPSDG